MKARQVHDGCALVMAATALMGWRGMHSEHNGQNQASAYDRSAFVTVATIVLKKKCEKVEAMYNCRPRTRQIYRRHELGKRSTVAQLQ